MAGRPTFFAREMGILEGASQVCCAAGLHTTGDATHRITAGRTHGEDRGGSPAGDLER